MPSNGFSLELPIRTVSNVKHHHTDEIDSFDELGSLLAKFKNEPELCFD
jgi:hypothetical protein